MASVNKVIIVGNLGADPEVKTFDNGGKIANISVATTEKWTDRNTGELKEHTEWHRITFSDRLADIVAQYLRKGSSVYVEGSLRTRKWQDPQTGQDRYSTEVRASSMQMLGSRQGGNDGYQNQNNGYQNNQFNNQYQNPQNFQNGNNFGGNQFAGNAGFNQQNNFPAQNGGYPQNGYNQAPQQMPAQMPQNNFAQNQAGHQGYNPAMSNPAMNAPAPTPIQPMQGNAFGSPNAPQAPAAPSTQATTAPVDDDMPF